MSFINFRNFCAGATVAFFAGPGVADTISPTSFSANLGVGDSVTIRKTVVVEEGSPTDATIDVHFAIDTSGSMGSQVNNAKAAATSLFNALNASFGDVAASVGVFSEGASLTDPDERGRAIIGGGLTTNAATFQADVNKVTLCNPDCGGDFPESGWTAMALAGDNLSWRPGSNRFMFVLTDASAKGTLAAAQASVTNNDINVVALSYGNLGTITASYATPFGGTAFASSTSVAAIIADVTAGISAGFANYSKVTIDDLGGGAPEIDVSTVCVSADTGACVGAEAVGTYDRSTDRTFEFDVTFTRTAAGDSAFDTFALVDGGIVAREADRFPDGAGKIPLPAAGWLLIAGLGGLVAMKRRKAA